jgi:hypothetical protein
LADSTHRHNRRSSPRLRSRLALTTAIVALAAGWGSPAAHADGDPASDVLTQQALFLPQDAGLTATEQAQLGALLQAATHRGYQIRVALIASSADLGSVTELWRQPQTYARFLGQELSLVYTGPLLVIMPDGVGFYHLNRPPANEQSALASLPAPAAGARLGTVALAAIQHLAAAAGHPLAPPSAIARAKPSSTDTVSWIVFAIGGTLIAVAWTASLRARPPHLRHSAST